MKANMPFPLVIAGEPGGSRFLQGNNGRPFFYQADTAWKLLFCLNAAEASEYFKIRKTQGFTVVQIILSGFLDDINREGRRPFGSNYDFSTPNHEFFDHAQRILDLAGDLDLLVALVPLWSGCCGEGWAGVSKDGILKPINLNGPDRCRAFGEWLGYRFQKHNNLLWVLGGDNDPDNARAEIKAMALGLKCAAPHQLITYHASSTHSSADVWPEDESWLDISMIYTYFRGFDKAWNKVQPDVYEVAAAERRKTPARPFILGESTYEGEHDSWGSALQIRKQAYWACLSGACGHAYGSPNWHLPQNWRDITNLPGANSLKHLANLLTPRAWHLLVPDESAAFFVSGREPYGRNDYATAAVASDGSFAVAYAPSARTLTCDLHGFEDMKSFWYDPANGSMREAAPENTGSRFTTPGLNTGGDPDWVLLIERQR